MFNPAFDTKNQDDFVGLEAPEWDPNTKYNKINSWSEDRKELYRSYYYTVDTGDMVWESQPVYNNPQLLNIYSYGKGYVAQQFRMFDFAIKQCLQSSHFLQ